MQTKGRALWASTKKYMQLRSKVKSAEQFNISPNSLHDAATRADYNGPDGSYNMETQQLRLFVGTWNVAGKTPTDEWVMQEWLCSHEAEAADIYVLGFQEIVPLNAGNVLGNEDKGVSAKKWDELIMRALNDSSSSSSDTYNYWSSDSDLTNTRRNSSTTTPSSPSSIDDNSFHACYDDMMGAGNALGGALLRRPVYDILPSAGTPKAIDGNARRHSSAEESCHINWDLYSSSETTSCSNYITPSIPNQLYVRIKSKQMVGLFTSVWIRRDLYRYVKAVDVSTVGCGIMGRLGNKGSISVSLSLHETNFCFICSHLKPGDKPTDIIRRNSDVNDILRRTKFRRSKKLSSLNLPKTILAHDRIIWFGDLNYRVSLPCKELRSLVTKGDWANLLQKDQLKYEQERDGVLNGWCEGPISFPPTYKYVPNSDAYIFMQHPQPHNAAQKRAPAWCDRILWYGKGLKQLHYTSTSTLRQSDHRPVSAMFIAAIESTHGGPLSIHDVPFKNSQNNPYNQSPRAQSSGDFTFPSLFDHMLAHSDSKCMCLPCNDGVYRGSTNLETPWAM